MNISEYNKTQNTGGGTAPPPNVCIIEKLPIDILILIFSQLPTEDRKNVALVCRQWRHLSLEAGKTILFNTCSVASAYFLQLQNKDNSPNWKHQVAERANHVALSLSKINANLDVPNYLQICKELKSSLEIVNWGDPMSRTALESTINWEVTTIYNFRKIVSDWRFYMLNIDLQLPLAHRQFLFLDILIRYPLVFAENGAFDTAKKMIADIHPIADRFAEDVILNLNDTQLVQSYNQLVYQGQDTIVETFKFLDSNPNHMGLALIGIANHILNRRNPQANILKYFEGFNPSDKLVLAFELSRRLLQQNYFDEALQIILHIAIPRDQQEGGSFVGKIFNSYFSSPERYNTLVSNVVKAIEACGTTDHSIQYMFYMIFDVIQEKFDDQFFDDQVTALSNLISDPGTKHNFNLSYMQYKFKRDNYVENTDFEWDFDPDSLMEIEL